MGRIRSVLVAAAALLVLAAPAAEARVTVPDGVRVQPVAAGIPHPSNLAFDPRGRLWVTSAGHQAAASDGVWLVRRRGARPRQVVSGLESALGVLWHRGELFVSHIAQPYDAGRVTAFSRFDGSGFRRQRVVVDGLPTGLHRVDSLAAGPDGRLYLGVGSESDAERSPHRLSATVVSFRPNGGGLRVEARGLRNPYGLAFVPGTRRLLVSEHGRDDLGLRSPPEEVNVIRTPGRARWFGFPECWGQGGAACRSAEPPLARLRAHSAPGGVAVAERFGRWGRSVFVARFGSSFDANPSGGDIVRVALGRGRGGVERPERGRERTGIERPGRGQVDRSGRGRGGPRPVRPRVERFATGFGRQEPLGLALGPSGRALYVTLWTSGRIVRLVLEPRPAAAAGRVLRKLLLQPFRIATTAGLGLLGLRPAPLSPSGHQDE
jgi:glucose/arabinose dehydrogenase